MADVKSAFDEFDGDGNGHIDLAEFRELVESLGVALETAEAEELFDTIDVDETGLIDFTEFEAWWTSSGLAPHE